MTADAANRKACRNEFTRLLTLAMVTNVQIVDSVIGYETVNVEGKSCVVVTSNGSRRGKRGISDDRWNNSFLFEVLSFVEKANTLSENQGGSNWTEKDVEDKLDDIDKYIADVVAANRSNPGQWSYIQFTDDYSDIIAGRERFIDRISETIPYKVESRLVEIQYIES